MRTRFLHTHASFLLLCFSCVLSGGGQAAEPSPWYIHGSLDARYRWEKSPDGSEQDLREHLSLRFGDTDRQIVTGHLSGYSVQSIQGRRNKAPLASIYDTYGSLYYYLSSAYLDIQIPCALMDSVRVGRQWLAGLPLPVRMDGITLRSGELSRRFQIRTSLYAGIPDAMGESSRRHDRVYGGDITMRPFRDSLWTVGYTRLHDDVIYRFGGTPRHYTFHDDVAHVRLRQHFWDRRLTGSGAYTFLNGRSRDARLTLAYAAPSGNTRVKGFAGALFNTQAQSAAATDPFVSVLRTYHPYHEAGIVLQHDFNDHFAAEAGWRIRRLSNNKDVGPYNHEFERYHMACDTTDWPWRGARLNATGNYYETGSDRFWALEGSWAQDFGGGFTLETGTAYALYETHRYTLEEREHVRSVFCRLSCGLTDDISLHGGYRLERHDMGNCHGLDLRIRIRF